MVRRVKAIVLLVALVAALAFAAMASGGTSADPLVSKSFVDVTFFDNVISDVKTKVASAVSSFKSKYINAAEKASDLSLLEDKFVAGTAQAVLENLQRKGKYLYATDRITAKKFSSGDVISGRQGMIFIVKSGTVRCTSGKVINITLKARINYIED